MAERARSASDVAHRIFDRCYECHTPIHNENDHVTTCGFKKRFQSDYVDRYMNIPTVRFVVASNTEIFYVIDKSVRKIRAGIDLFSAVADVYIKPISSTKFAVLTTGFTRIRLPIVVKEHGTAKNLVEKIVFMTSVDRTVVAAHSGRNVSVNTVLKDFEHNTPVVCFLNQEKGGDLNLSIEVFSASGSARNLIEFDNRNKKYVIPSELDVRSQNWGSRPFDADIKKFN